MRPTSNWKPNFRDIHFKICSNLVLIRYRTLIKTKTPKTIQNPLEKMVICHETHFDDFVLKRQIISKSSSAKRFPRFPG